MKRTSEQSAGWGMRLMRDPFSRALFSLTALFAGGILVVLLVMNVVMYSLFIKNLHIEHGGRLGLIPAGETIAGEENAEEALSEEVRERLTETLFIVDVLVLVLAVLVGYVLARKTLEPIQRSYERQKRFVSDAAHELRTPLAVMKAGVEVTLTRGRDESAYKMILKDVLEEIGTLTYLTDDLLLLSREERMHVPAYAAISLSDCVEHELHLMRPYAEAAGVVLTGIVDNDIKIFGDADSIGRVVTNLLKNAIDYTGAGGTVRATLSADSGSATFTVADTGVGIAEKDIPHLFERFYKADTARVVRRGNGAGLGLSIVQEIVHNHGGTVAVSSTLGVGTTVTAVFPVRDTA